MIFQLWLFQSLIKEIMNLKSIVFYYHIPVFKDKDKLLVPSFLGVFIDSLASNVGTLFLLMHEVSNQSEADYILKSPNIKFVSLGLKTPAWHRMIFHKKILAEKLNEIKHCDYFIVRSPSPLAPFFSRYFDFSKIVFMVVGDYAEGRKQMEKKTLRSFLINVFLMWNDYLFLKEMKRTSILVNSPALFQKYEPIALKTSQIKTTTLSEKDFYERLDTCQGDIIKLLFTGRIDLAKGLVELVSALAELNKKEKKYTLNIVGWEAKKEQPVQKQLLELARQIGQESQLTFHGKMSIGEELNSMYRQSDIYIIPSYHEGFPRTIWESMANSCPVIASRVGSIPYFLSNGEALLIEPKNINQIVEAVKNMVSNTTLRQNLIKKGFEIAKTNTLEFQTKELLSKIYVQK
jgi:glycosyltransferase involved in cell wall biosynthesis